MAYATRDDYVGLYRAIGEKRFARLIWEAERVMDDATMGVDLVRKLRVAFPTEPDDSEAVKRCACALVDIMRSVEDAENAASKAAAASSATITHEDGTVTGKVVTGRSAGSESITYAAPGASQGGKTALDSAVSDSTARRQLLAETVRKYLTGARDANGVNLLYLGIYPVIP